MKKQLTALLLIFVLLFAMAGCSAANAVQKMEAVEDLAETKLDAAEDKLEAALREAVKPAPAQTPTASADSSHSLTQEQAQQIAFDYLGFSADQVTRLHTEYEIDDGIPQYDVSFYQGDWEYEFEIHAENGKILSYDRDHKYD